MRLAAYLLGIAISTFLLFQVQSPTAIGLWTGVATALLIPVIDLFVANWKHLRTAWWSVRYYRQDVRFSISYLIRIFVDGKYLLVRGRRFPNQLQPVGGVYKTHPSAKDTVSKLRVKNDDLIPLDSESRGDLRVRVQGRFIVPFLQWFESGRNREVGPSREFYEELVATGVLPSDEFATIECDYIRTHQEPIRYSEFARSQEVLIAHIFELVPSDEQLAVLRSLNSSVDVKWVSEERIRRRGVMPGEAPDYEIPITAQWML